METEANEYPQEIHDEQESGASYNKHEDPQVTQPQPLPAQYQYANPGAYPPPMYNPPQATQQRFPHQAGYVPPQPVQAPPQNYQKQPNPQGYNKPQNYQTQPNPQGYNKPQNYQTQPNPQGYNNAQPASPYNPGAAPPGINQNVNYGAPAQGYVVQQSPYQQSPYANNPGTVPWTTGLFDCMEDPTNALLTACVPCFTFGQIAEIIDKGQTTCGTSGILYAVIALFTAVPCLISCTYRTKLRNQYDLIEVPAADWITHCFCEWCALCQAYRELRNRGLDPALGWQGNMMRNQQMQQPQVAMTPPPNQNMGGPNMAR